MLGVMLQLDDNHLRQIQAAKAGNREAFAQLVRSYKDFVYRTAYAILHDGAEAEDVVQESFVKAFLSLRSLRDERAFPSWISTIATRIALDIVKRRQVSWAPVSNSERLPAPSVNSDLRLDMEAALAQLSPEHRAVLVLREVQGFDYREIADILGIPIGTVRSRLHTARMQLRLRLLPPEQRGEPQ